MVYATNASSDRHINSRKYPTVKHSEKNECKKGSTTRPFTSGGIRVRKNALDGDERGTQCHVHKYTFYIIHTIYAQKPKSELGVGDIMWWYNTCG